MIYQPRNVQPSNTSVDGSKDNVFTMEAQTNYYISAYQLLISDFDNEDVYIGDKVELDTRAYNGDVISIPVEANTVMLSNGTNYKWRVKLYQPTADMLITYGLVQQTSTETNIYTQPNINIREGMTITINGQTQVISSYDVDTGVAVVSTAFSEAPDVGAQYIINSDFIETVPDYIVYARETPTVSINNIPSSLTLKYHTFQGVYNQNDNVPIVYHQFDLYLKNNDGSKTLIDTSGKIYSANLTYTYNSFRTGNTYIIQMTVENDMGISVSTELYEFDVTYDIVEYLQQPQATLDSQQNAIQVSWVAPVENEGISTPSNVATGTVQSNNNTSTSATFESGQVISQGDIVRLTNSDFNLKLYGKSEQVVTQGYNLLPNDLYSQNINGITITKNNDGSITLNGTATQNVSLIIADLTNFSLQGTYNFYLIGKNDKINLQGIEDGETVAYLPYSYNTNNYITKEYDTSKNLTRIFSYISSGKTFNNETFKYMITRGSDVKNYEPYSNGIPSPSPDYPQEINSIEGSVDFVCSGKNLIPVTIESQTQNGVELTKNENGSITLNGTATKGTQFNLSSNITLKEGTYTNSSNYIKSKMYVSLDNIADTMLNGANLNRTKTFTINNETTYNNYFIYLESGATFNNETFELMIEPGGQATQYEPYKTPVQISLDLGEEKLISAKAYNSSNIAQDTLTVDLTTGDYYKEEIFDSLYNITGNEEVQYIEDNTYPYFVIRKASGNASFVWCNIAKNVGTIANMMKPENNNTFFWNSGSIGFRFDDITSIEDFKNKIKELNQNSHQVYIVQPSSGTLTPTTVQLGTLSTEDLAKFKSVSGNVYMSANVNINTSYDIIYPSKTISAQTNDSTKFNPAGQTQTVTVNSYNKTTGVVNLMSNSTFTYIPIQGDYYQVIGNMYNETGFQILYNTPYKSVNSLYTHGYTMTWAAPNGLCVLPEDFNITLQFSPDGNFYYNSDGTYQEVVNLINASTDDPLGNGNFAIKIDKNKLLFTQNPDISLELPFYTNTTQVFVLSPDSAPQINNDYIWDDDATWNDTYTWVEGGTSIERICNHWWKIQITNTTIKIEEIFPAS